MQVTCKVCGRIFDAWPSKFRSYCSKECYRASGGVKIICKVCGKEFKVRPNEANSRKTCSKECLSKWPRKPRPKHWKTKNCEICGREFHFYPTKRGDVHRFCSNKCRSAGFSRDRKQKRRAHFEKSFTKDRNFRRVLRRHLQEFGGQKCLICGWDEASVDVCHITPRKEGGESTLRNVVFLCPNHHRMYDEGLIQREHLVALAQQQYPHITDFFQLPQKSQ